LDEANKRLPRLSLSLRTHWLLRPLFLHSSCSPPPSPPQHPLESQSWSVATMTHILFSFPDLNAFLRFFYFVNSLYVIVWILWGFFALFCSGLVWFSLTRIFTRKPEGEGSRARSVSHRKGFQKQRRRLDPWTAPREVQTFCWFSIRLFKF
jgi:hypothetical protein